MRIGVLFYLMLAFLSPLHAIDTDFYTYQPAPVEKESLLLSNETDLGASDKTTNIDVSETLPFFHQTTPIEEDYILSNYKLGNGSFAIVIMATHRITGEEVAVKVMTVTPKNYLTVNREALILRYLASAGNHEHLVHFRESYFYQPDKNAPKNGIMYLVMEKISGEDFFEYLVANPRMDHALATHLASQMASALRHLKKMGIAHRDLKPENMIYIPNERKIVIIDLGMGKFFNVTKTKRDTDCGSRHYAPPEIFLKGVPDLEKRDDFSAGVILYVMVTKQLPWPVPVPNDHPSYIRLLIEQIKKDNYMPIPLKKNDPSHNAFAKFIHSLLSYEENRPDLSEAGQQVLKPLKECSLQVIYQNHRTINLKAVKYILHYIAMGELGLDPQRAIRSILNGDFEFINIFYDFLAKQFPASPLLDVDFINDLKRKVPKDISRLQLVKFFIEKMDVSEERKTAALEKFVKQKSATLETFAKQKPATLPTSTAPGSRVSGSEIIFGRPRNLPDNGAPASGSLRDLFERRMTESGFDDIKLDKERLNTPRKQGKKHKKKNAKKPKAAAPKMDEQASISSTESTTSFKGLRRLLSFKRRDKYSVQDDQGN